MQPTLHMHQHPPGTSLSWASGMSDSNSENMQVALSDYISGGKRPYTPIPESQNLFPTKFRQHMPLKEWQLLSQNRISQRPPPSELSENFMVPIFTQTSQQNASDKFWNNDIFDDEDDIPIYERIGTTTNPSYMAFPNWWELKDHHYASILLNLRNGLMHRRDEAIRKRYKKQVQKIKDEIRNHNKQIFRERREDNERYHHVHEQTTFEDISTFIRDLERQLPSSTMKRIKKMESDLKRKHTPNILKIHREERRRERKQERKDEEMNRRLSKDVQQPYPSTEFNSNFNFTTTTTTNSSALPEPMDLPVTYHPDMQPKDSSQREHITYAAESLHSHDAIIQENPFPTEDSNAESDAEEMDMDAMSDDGMRSLVDSSEDEDEYTQRHGTRHYDISDEYDSDTDDTEYEDVFERILQHFRQHNSSTTTSSTTPATGITEMPTTTDKGVPSPTHRRLRGAESGAGIADHVYGAQVKGPVLGGYPGGPATIRPLTHGWLSSKPNSIALAAVAAAAGTCASITMMAPGGTHGTNNSGNHRRTHRDPPGWNPERESSYSFRSWNQDLLCWCILANDMDEAQQAAAIVQQLQGSARELARNMTFTDITTGGLVNGVQTGPVTFLLSHLAQHFAPLGEESRLTALSELMNFHRIGGESIDALQARFRTLRFRAQQGGQGLTMSWEGYAWQLLKACRVNHQQLLNILQPYQGRFPSSEPEFDSMQLTLRRMGHILENAHGNIAAQLRSSPSNFFTNDEQNAQPQDPWSSGPDPWSNADNTAGQYATTPQEQPTDPWGGWQGRTDNMQPPTHPPATNYYGNADDDMYVSDSETSSDDQDEADYSDPALQGLQPHQIDEAIFWAYRQAKRQWRRHMHKPTRRVRKFVRTKGKGKGKGRGKSRFAFLEQMGDLEYDNTYFGGKGKSKGKRRSGGKGKGRRTNPRGRDGRIMTCSICGAEDHFRAECPRGGTDHSNTGTTAFASYSGMGPLGDLLGNSEAQPSTQTYVTFDVEPTAPTTNTNVQAPPHVHIDGLWGSSGATSPSDSNPFGIRNTLPPNGTNIFAPQVAPQQQQQQHQQAASVDWNAVQPEPIPPPPAPSVLQPPAPVIMQPHAPAVQPQVVNQSGPFVNLENVLAHRNEVVEQVLRNSTPQATAQLTPPPEVNTAMTHMSDFSRLEQLRRTQVQQRNARESEHAPPAWQHFSTPPGLTPVGVPSTATGAATQEFHNYAADMHLYQQANTTRIHTERRERRRRAAERFSRQQAEAVDEDMQSQNTPAQSAATNDAVICTICMETVTDGDTIATLNCQHSFHLECIDTWVTHSFTDPRATHARCPQCRAVLIVSAQTIYQSQAATFDISTPRDASPAVTESQYGTPQSRIRDLNTTTALPWWPSALQYHSMTQLADGRLSIIVDPGAWTNLMGAKLARKLVKRAMAAGHKPKQMPMERLNVQGVGNGSQACNFKLQCPIAIPHEDGASHLHKISTPIVEGNGEDLPGLLGLRSLETDRAILDTGKRMLYYPGPGEVEIVLPPGSIAIPLEKAPSGHLVMPIDEYERCSSVKGGTPETSLNLVAAFSKNKNKECSAECCDETQPCATTPPQDNTEDDVHHFTM